MWFPRPTEFHIRTPSLSFRGIYGPDGIEIQSEIGKRETIWEYMDVYVIVARNDEKDVVISYMQKSLFETENQKDVENTTKQSRGGNKMAARKGGLGKGFEALSSQTPWMTSSEKRRRFR